MLNLSSTPDQIIQELSADLPHVKYWADRNSPDLQQWIEETEGKEGPHILFGSEYTSKNENRWMTFYTQLQSEPGQPIVGMFPFIYYETIGSIGVFSPVDGRKRLNAPDYCGCLIFTSHFFRRLCERSKIDFGSRDMLMKFVLTLNTFKVHPTKVNEQGQEEVILKLVDGQGMGIRLRQEPMVVEIRTYLNESQLNNYQHKQFEACKQKVNIQINQQELQPILMALSQQAFQEAGYIPKHDIRFWEQCKKECAMIFLEASRMWDVQIRLTQDNSLRYLITAIAHHMHVPNFDIQRFEPIFYKLKMGHYDALMMPNPTRSLYDLGHRPRRSRF